MLKFRRIILLAPLCAILLFGGYSSALSQRVVQTPLVSEEPIQGYGELQELQDLKIVGCVYTTPEQILGVIQSRQSDVSLTRKLTEYYYLNLKRNTATPPMIQRTLTSLYKDLASEIRYFNQQTAEDDSAAILRYLQQSGFHNAKVNFFFGFTEDLQANVLQFNIVEGKRAVIDTVIYAGLESVNEEVLNSAFSVRSIESGAPFSETEFEAEVKAVVLELQNNGYFRCTYEAPLVVTSRDGLHDSVLVKINPGRRVRIAQIVMEENLNGQPGVNESTRTRQLEFAEGEWYSRKKVEVSRANLMSLGTFEMVLIDTVFLEFFDAKGVSTTDSNIALKVFTKNIKVYDVGANLLLYQTSIDNYLNGGVGLTAQYKNLFGGAQVVSATMQYVLQDLSRAFQKQNIETEALASMVLAWPNITRVYGNRVGLQTNTFYSLRVLVFPFKLESFGISARTPINLYKYTFFNRIDLNIGLERQVPRDFRETRDSALKNEANTPQDSAFVLSTYNQFTVLDNYLQNSRSFFTGVFAGISISGEHRDNLTNPTRGTFTNFATELGLGAGQFLRMQFFNTTVSQVAPRSFIATKIRVGHIALLGFSRGSGADTNTYVPLERQFFAGGAASIRSYPSRLLHDPHSGTIVNPDTSAEDPLSSNKILSNVIGSGSLFELGFEFRYTFARPRGIDDFWASIIERSGITFFTDIGNAFNRLTPSLYGKMRLQDLWEGSVVAVGVGYRFDTPVGPFRVDYATSAYDPLRTEGRWILNGRKNVMGFSNWQLSIGLGHAF